MLASEIENVFGEPSDVLDTESGLVELWSDKAGWCVRVKVPGEQPRAVCEDNCQDIWSGNSKLEALAAGISALTFLQDVHANLVSV